MEFAAKGFALCLFPVLPFFAGFADFFLLATIAPFSETVSADAHLTSAATETS